MELLFSHDAWVHGTLIAVDVLATIAVGWGIIWEAPEQSPSRHKIAKWLVMSGIAFECIASVLLFAFDETISQSQQEKIIALESRIAPRILTNKQQAELGIKIASFAGKKVVVSSFELDFESMALGQYVTQSLRRAHILAFEKLRCFRGPDFEAVVHVTGSNRALVDSLSGGLKSEGILVSPDRVNEVSSAQDMCGQRIPSDATIFVGPKLIAP